WAHQLLKEDGLFYIRVPNFSRNPNDLFCADHLSKLTIHSLESLAHAAGFDVLSSKEAGVPIFVLLRKGNGSGSSPVNVAELNQNVVDQNATVAKDAMDAIDRCHKAAKASGEPFAI